MTNFNKSSTKSSKLPWENHPNPSTKILNPSGLETDLNVFLYFNLKLIKMVKYFFYLLVKTAFKFIKTKKWMNKSRSLIIKNT